MGQIWRWRNMNTLFGYVDLAAMAYSWLVLDRDSAHGPLALPPRPRSWDLQFEFLKWAIWRWQINTPWLCRSRVAFQNLFWILAGEVSYKFQSHCGLYHLHHVKAKVMCVSRRSPLVRHLHLLTSSTASCVCQSTRFTYRWQPRSCCQGSEAWREPRQTNALLTELSKLA